MSFHPPLRPEVKPKPPKEWYEELMDRDEILLYFTASLGVLLPGIVYVIYHKVHNIYINYAKKKEQLRLAEEAARSEVAIIPMCTEDSVAQRFAKQLESILKAEMVNPPKLWPITTLKAKEFAVFKGFCVFVVETLSGGTALAPCDWFLEWLEDVAADAKQKKKANFEALKFIIIGFGSSDDGEANFNRNQASAENGVCRRGGVVILLGDGPGL
ncbi:Flavodoxin domain-containing protein [Trichostrongylus colubriformis]|uniref:Flavodoxin domain-containing protein n=1 Tax=Trichostrongylus colubriformis TaxID=6319 RepID=A0AAN8IRJ3_TRICO